MWGNLKKIMANLVSEKGPEYFRDLSSVPEAGNRSYSGPFPT